MSKEHLEDYEISTSQASSQTGQPMTTSQFENSFAAERRP